MAAHVVQIGEQAAAGVGLETQSFTCPGCVGWEVALKRVLQGLLSTVSLPERQATSGSLWKAEHRNTVETFRENRTSLLPSTLV